MTPRTFAARVGRRPDAFRRGACARVRRHARRDLEAGCEARRRGARRRSRARAPAIGSRAVSICSTRRRVRAALEPRRGGAASRSSKCSRSSTRRTGACSRAPPPRRLARRLHRRVPDRAAAAGEAAAGARRSAAASALSVGWQFAGRARGAVGAHARRRRRRCAAFSRASPASRSRSSGRTTSCATSASSAASCSRSQRGSARRLRTSSPASASTWHCPPRCCRRSAIGRVARWISRRHSVEAPPSRAVLAAALVGELAALFADYATRGFRRVSHRVARPRTILRGRRVRLDDAAGTVSGTALGIEADGALLDRDRMAARRRVVAGDVSVRSVG